MNELQTKNQNIEHEMRELQLKQLNTHIATYLFITKALSHTNTPIEKPQINMFVQKGEENKNNNKS